MSSPAAQSSRGIPSRRALRTALLGILLVAACGGGPLASGTTPAPGESGAAGLPSAIPGATPQGSPAPDAAADALAARLRQPKYTTDSTAAAEEALARSGVATYASPSDQVPVVPLTGSSSGLRLLEFQTHGLAVDAWGGKGISGSELDQQLPIPASLHDASAPASAFVAGYVAAVSSPGAALSRSLMAGQDLTRPADLRVPPLVLVLFTADLATDAGRLTSAVASSGAIEAAFRSDGGSTPGVGHLVGLATICSDAANFVDQTINSLFSALKVAIPDNTVGAVVATIWNWIVDQGAAFVKTLLHVVTDVVLATIRAIAGGIAAIAEQVASIIPYVVTVRVEPDSPIALLRNPVFSRFTATVSAGDLPDWPDVMKDCAQTAQVALPSFRGRDAQVAWGTPSIDQPALVSLGTFETVTDANGEARWTFLAGPDPGEAPGADRSASITIDLVVHRPELDAARSKLTDALLSGVPTILRPFVGEVFSFFVAPLQKAVNDLIDTKASGSAGLTYHDTPPPTPIPSAGPSAPASIAGTWNGTWASDQYVGLTGGFTLNFVQRGSSLSGTITINGSKCISGATISGQLSGNKISFGAVKGAETVAYEGTWSGAAMGGTWAVTQASGGECTMDSGSWQAAR